MRLSELGAGAGGEGMRLAAAAAATVVGGSTTIAAAVVPRAEASLSSHCAIGVPTATVVPDGTSTFASVPALGALTS